MRTQSGVLALWRDLPRRLPFYYGWVVVACVAAALVARQGASVAVLSVFVKPMGDAFGWSRAQLSGAVSVGNIVGALTAPIWGRWADRAGAQGVLILSVLLVGVGAIALSQVSTLWGFYVAYGMARLAFASTVEIGANTAIATWFIRRRAVATAVANFLGGLAQGALPIIVQAVIGWRDWRAGWLAVAGVAMGVGLLPNAVLVRRRPEDVGLAPDGVRSPTTTGASPMQAPRPAGEVSFTLRDALRTPTLWILASFTGIAFLVQAGVSLHQAPHLMQRGIPPVLAAGMVSGFGFASSTSNLLWGLAASRWPIRYVLVATTAVMVAGVSMLFIARHPVQGFAGTILFGAGVGGLLTLVPVAWANYYGRANLGTIRGVTLPVQVGGQAMGPLLIGALYDWRQSYEVALLVAGALAALAGCLALLARPPRLTGATTRER
ncbi:MAG: MFS transporter [Dehalococcoidia bacterium]|nr:MFS transporter [Dehalococcoidia bacterium]MDW8119339.1 MFS transporter [Chloroflexota bacterium]